MRRLGWLAPGALLSLVACGSVDRNALNDPNAADAGQSVTTDRGAPTTNTDSGNPWVPIDAGTVTPPPPVDAGTVTPPPPVDAGTVTPPPPIDAGTVTPPPPIDAGTVTPPPVDAGTCRACTAFAPVTFCAAPGMGACLPYAGCTADSCATCATATAGGDNCSNPITISASGQHRTVITTCGASNDLDTGCGRNGPDVVVALRVARGGRVVTRFTVPPGVSVNYGYDYPAVVCRNQRFGRPCSDTSTSSTQGFDLTLAAGTAYLYVETSVPSTIVVETLLP